MGGLAGRPIAMRGSMTKIETAEQKKPARSEKSSTVAKRSVKPVSGRPIEPAGAAREVGVVIEYDNQMAREIYIAGSFNNWDPRARRLARQRNGKWTATLSLAPGRYEYRLVVDGKWQEDSGAAKFAANPFGGFNSIIEVDPA
jgi:hypothetical protein